MEVKTETLWEQPWNKAAQVMVETMWWKVRFFSRWFNYAAFIPSWKFSSHLRLHSCSSACKHQSFHLHTRFTRLQIYILKALLILVGGGGVIVVNTVFCHVYNLLWFILTCTSSPPTICLTVVRVFPLSFRTKDPFITSPSITQEPCGVISQRVRGQTGGLMLFKNLPLPPN